MSKRVEIVGALCDSCGKTGVVLNKQANGDLLCSGCEAWLQNEEN